MRTTNKLVVVGALAACGRAGVPAPAMDADPPPVDGSINASADASIDAMTLPPQTSRLRIVNACTQPIWIAHSNQLSGEQNVRLANGEYHDYAIPPSGVG